MDQETVDHRLPSIQHDRDRIGFLDGFRGIAILAVVFYHYYSFYASDERGLYPFGDRWSSFPLFEYGFYGVHLFFAVSGFVISLTLMRCESLREFTVRRFARLWPTMLLCSFLTFVFLCVFPVYWPQELANFLPSLTFVDGMHYERFFPDVEFNWIDGAYWSLFVEVRFYAIAAVLYFMGPTRFLEHMLGFSLLVFVVFWGLVVAQQERAANIVHDLCIPTYLPWFLFGIAAHCLWLGKRRWAITLAAISYPPLFLSSATTGAWHDLAVALLICGLFLACFRFSALRILLSARWLTAVGVSSYSLYLLHQNIGVTATSLLAQYWSVPARLSLLLPLLVAGVLVVVAQLIFRLWETPLSGWIVRSFRRRVAARIPSNESAR